MKQWQTALSALIKSLLLLLPKSWQILLALIVKSGAIDWLIIKLTDVLFGHDEHKMGEEQRTEIVRQVNTAKAQTQVHQHKKRGAK